MSDLKISQAGKTDTLKSIVYDVWVKFYILEMIAVYFDALGQNKWYITFSNSSPEPEFADFVAV